MIRFFSLLSVILVSSVAWSLEQEWLTLQLRKKVLENNQVSFEYLKRDEARLFTKNYSEEFSLSWGGSLSVGSYSIGALYVDLDQGADESRLHQFFSIPWNLNETMITSLRLGLEERSFVSDSNWYLRQRTRFQVTLFPEANWGPIFYNEIYYIPDGKKKFKNGINENRLAAGFRLSHSSLDFNLFYVSVDSQSVTAKSHSKWLLLQVLVKLP